MVSITWTAVAGSLTVGDSARKPMSARSRKANSGSCRSPWTILSSPVPSPPWCCCGHEPCSHPLLRTATAQQTPPSAWRLGHVEELAAGNFPALWSNTAYEDAG